ncbi:hypothetical protein HK101_003120 [Irineochytrium annulatum]|nr:hypothetical protein HK101_003120 [Irineochytrium annulatum]
MFLKHIRHPLDFESACSEIQTWSGRRARRTGLVLVSLAVILIGTLLLSFDYAGGAIEALEGRIDALIKVPPSLPRCRILTDDLDEQPPRNRPVITRPRPKRIHLLGQWYWPDRPQRARELVTALAANVNNTFVHAIHLIQPPSFFASFDAGVKRSDDDRPTRVNTTDDEVDLLFSRLTSIDSFFPLAMFLRKLVLVSTAHEGRLLASDAFRHATAALNPQGDPRRPYPEDAAILINQDIAFDSTLGLLLTSPDSDLSPFTTYFLSRYEVSEAAERTSLIGTQCGPKFVGSADAIAFVPPLPAPLVEECGFELGSWGIEARLLWEFERFGIKGRNPCEDVRTWHLHWAGVKDPEAGNTGTEEKQEEKRARVMPEVNGDGKSSVAFPDSLRSRFKNDVEEVWGQVV